jgi:hypothetical protein
MEKSEEESRRRGRVRKERKSQEGEE